MKITIKYKKSNKITHFMKITQFSQNLHLLMLKSIISLKQRLKVTNSMPISSNLQYFNSN